jgi:hypothetical protein
MRAVEAALGHLNPICVDVDAHQHAVALGQLHEGMACERRLLLFRAEIGPHHAASLDDGIGGRPELRRLAVRWIVHDLQHLAVGAEFPAVIEAANAAIFHAAQRQRRGAMDAEFVEHADLAVAATEHDKVLAEQPLRNRRTARRGQPVRRADRQPEAPEQGPHRRSRANPAKPVILFARHHGRLSSLVDMLFSAGTVLRCFHRAIHLSI